MKPAENLSNTNNPSNESFIAALIESPSSTFWLPLYCCLLWFMTSVVVPHDNDSHSHKHRVWLINGKLVHWGLEGLQASNQLIDLAHEVVTLYEATARTTTATNSAINELLMTCDGLARDMLLSDWVEQLANKLDHVEQLQQMANELPQYFEWLDADQAKSLLLHDDLPMTATD